MDAAAACDQKKAMACLLDPLLLAVVQNHLPVVKLLLLRGADLNLVKRDYRHF